MNSINKFQTLIIGAAGVLGLILGMHAGIRAYAGYLIIPFLIIMLLGLFLNTPVRHILKSYSNHKFFFAATGINFVWTPLYAWLLGYLLLQHTPDLRIGFLMLMVTPCTDWYLVFTGAARGNVSLSASLLPLNLVLQIILLPVYLLLFSGQEASIEFQELLESIILVLLLPFFFARLLKYIQFKHAIPAVQKSILPFLENSQVIFLGLAIMAMFAAQGTYITNNPGVVLQLLVLLLLFFAGNFFVGRYISHIVKFKYVESVSLTMTTLARNSPVALAIAVTAFPDRPLIALALVIGPLIELPVLALVSQVLLMIKK